MTQYFSATTRIDSWKSNGISEENIKNITKSENNFAPTFVDQCVLPDITFNGNCLINHIYIPKKQIVQIYIYIYTFSPWLRNFQTDFTLKN